MEVTEVMEVQKLLEVTEIMEIIAYSEFRRMDLHIIIHPKYLAESFGYSGHVMRSVVEVFYLFLQTE